MRISEMQTHTSVKLTPENRVALAAELAKLALHGSLIRGGALDQLRAELEAHHSRGTIPLDTSLTNFGAF
jgi:hypothetical protein